MQPSISVNLMCTHFPLAFILFAVPQQVLLADEPLANSKEKVLVAFDKWASTVRNFRMEWTYHNDADVIPLLGSV